MRLTDDFAARRRLYARPTFTAPMMMVIDVPPPMAGAGLPLGRYYPVILETDEELAEFEAFLGAKRPGPAMPDILATRPGTLRTAVISLFEYAPPEPGWPWLLLCHWPEDDVMQAAYDLGLLVRGAYSIDIYSDRKDLIATVAILAANIDAAKFSIVSNASIPQGSA